MARAKVQRPATLPADGILVGFFIDVVYRTPRAAVKASVNFAFRKYPRAGETRAGGGIVEQLSFEVCLDTAV